MKKREQIHKKPNPQLENKETTMNFEEEKKIIRVVVNNYRKNGNLRYLLQER